MHERGAVVAAVSAVVVADGDDCGLIARPGELLSRVPAFLINK
jgi:hypothetical protein